MAARALVTVAERKTWQKLAVDVLVEHRRFSESAWLPHFQRLLKTIARCQSVLENIGAELKAGDPDPREILVWAWCVLMAKPEDEAQHYLRIPETSGDGRGFDEEVRALRASRYVMQGLKTAHINQMRWLGALVRTIDADLAGLDFWPEDRESWKPDQWVPTGYPCYVIPVNRAYRAEDGMDRARRAILYHAIVPRQLGDLTVEIALHPDVDPQGQGRSWLYGSAMFDSMTIDVDLVEEDGFRVVGAPLADDEGLVREQVDQAIAASSDVLSWPELTVPEQRLAHIKKALNGDPLATASRISLTVAGTWHIEASHGWVNRAHILHGRGQRLASYDKRRWFAFDGRYERIEPGKSLLVIVTDDRLVSIAICKDFCDDVPDKVYDWLGVDLVLVPSMGNKKTLDAHRRSAKILQSRQGAVSVLVQQVPVVTGASRSDGEPPAYSFASPPAPDATSDETDFQNIAFRALRARR